MTAADFSLTARLRERGVTLEGAEALELVAVMPAYNEEENLPVVVGEWVTTFRSLGIRFAFLVINDGSKDRTGEVLARLEGEYPEVIGWNKSNDGHGGTCRKGYEQAVATRVPWVFQIDSDGQCDPKFFPDFWKARNEADLLFGERVSRDDGLARVLTSRACRWGTFLWTGASLRDPNVPYRLLRSEALQRGMQRIPPDFQIYNVALSLALSREKGLRWRYFPIHFPNRAGGVNSINLRAVARMGFQMLSELKRVQ